VAKEGEYRELLITASQIWRKMNLEQKEGEDERRGLEVKEIG